MRHLGFALLGLLLGFVLFQGEVIAHSYFGEHEEISLTPDPDTATQIPAPNKDALEKCRLTPPDPNQHFSPGYTQWIAAAGEPTRQTIEVDYGTTTVNLDWNFSGVICWANNRVVNTKSRVYSGRAFALNPSGEEELPGALGNIVGDIFFYNWGPSVFSTVGSFTSGASGFTFSPSGGFTETKTYRIELDTRTINEFDEYTGPNSFLCVRPSGPSIFVSNLDQFTGGPNGDCPLTESSATTYLTVEVKNKPYDHTIRHGRYADTPVEVEVGETVRVYTVVCNAGAGQLHPESPNARDLDIRIFVPREESDPSKTFPRVGQANYSSYGVTTISGAERGPDALWRVSNHNHTPEPDTDSGGCAGFPEGGIGGLVARFEVPLDAVPGEKYCYTAALSPNEGLGGPDSTETSGYEEVSQKGCFTVINKPYYKVENGHIWSGAIFASEIGSCDASTVTSYLADNAYDTSTRGAIRGHNKLLNNSNVGASGDQGVFGLGQVAIPSAGTQQVGAGGGEERGTGLTFSNTGPSVGWYNDAFENLRGYFHNGYGPTDTTMLSPPKCVDDYFEQILDEKGDDISNHSGTSFVLNSAHDGGVFRYTGSQPLKIKSTNHELRERTTILAETDVIIEDDIVVRQAELSNNGVLKIPNLTIITKGGNIKVYYNSNTNNVSAIVDRIDARLITLPDESGNGGQLHTCVDNNNNPIFELSVDECQLNLQINGQIIAKNIYLQRTGGVARGLHRLTNSSHTQTSWQRFIATEVIDYTPEELFMSHIIGGKTGDTANGSRDDIETPTILNRRELPPIY